MKWLKLFVFCDLLRSRIFGYVQISAQEKATRFLSKSIFVNWLYHGGRDSICLDSCLVTVM